MVFGRKGKRKLEPPTSAGFTAEARANPSGWVYEIADGWDPNGAVPPGAIVRGWKIGPTGTPTGEYQDNPNHDPDLRPPTST